VYYSWRRGSGTYVMMNGFAATCHIFKLPKSISLFICDCSSVVVPVIVLLFTIGAVCSVKHVFLTAPVGSKMNASFIMMTCLGLV